MSSSCDGRDIVRANAIEIVPIEGTRATLKPPGVIRPRRWSLWPVVDRPGYPGVVPSVTAS